jgi:hypothetical protein
MRRGDNKIDEESVCIDSLVQHLLGLHESLVKIEREPEDPPDFWLSLGCRRFAVEVTSITADQSYAALCKHLHSLIKKLCIGFPGTYVIDVFRRPDIPKRESKQWKALVAEMTAIIRDMSASLATNEIVVLSDRGGSLSLSKLKPEGSVVGLMHMPEPKWEGDVQVELSSLLGAAIKRKRERIAKKHSADQCDGVILALYDAYGFGDLDAARQALSRLQGHEEWLHSIYWAASFMDRLNLLYPESPGRFGEFLYSKEEAWQSAPNPGAAPDV